MSDEKPTNDANASASNDNPADNQNNEAQSDNRENEIDEDYDNQQNDYQNQRYSRGESYNRYRGRGRSRRGGYRPRRGGRYRYSSSGPDSRSSFSQSSGLLPNPYYTPYPYGMYPPVAPPAVSGGAPAADEITNRSNNNKTKAVSSWEQGLASYQKRSSKKSSKDEEYDEETPREERRDPGREESPSRVQSSAENNGSSHPLDRAALLPSPEREPMPSHRSHSPDMKMERPYPPRRGRPRDYAPYYPEYPPYEETPPPYYPNFIPPYVPPHYAPDYPYPPYVPPYRGYSRRSPSPPHGYDYPSYSHRSSGGYRRRSPRTDRGSYRSRGRYHDSYHSIPRGADSDEASHREYESRHHESRRREDSEERKSKRKRKESKGDRKKRSPDSREDSRSSASKAKDGDESPKAKRSKRSQSDEEPAEASANSEVIASELAKIDQRLAEVQKKKQLMEELSRINAKMQTMQQSKPKGPEDTPSEQFSPATEENQQ